MIKKCIITFISMFLFLIQCSCSKAVDLPEAGITVNVVDEEGKLIEGAKVSVGFEVLQEPHVVKIEGLTNNNGIFSASNRSTDGIAFAVSKLGYYNSRGGYHFDNYVNSKWQPWNPEVKIVLRKIENPVPMFARDTKMSGLEIPEIGKDIGFDLTEYAWVTPYGKGKHSDFSFKLTSNFINDNDFDCTLTIAFTNKYDGIQVVKNEFNGNEFKLPRFAPESGYQNKLSFSIKKSPGREIDKNYNEKDNYIFRIRSTEKNGKIEKAMYGKILGGIYFYPRKVSKHTAMIHFKYYVNPDYTTNLEYDLHHNLFTNLQSTETVGLE